MWCHLDVGCYWLSIATCVCRHHLTVISSSSCIHWADTSTPVSLPSAAPMKWQQHVQQPSRQRSFCACWMAQFVMRTNGTCDLWPYRKLIDSFVNGPARAILLLIMWKLWQGLATWKAWELILPVMVCPTSPTLVIMAQGQRAASKVLNLLKVQLFLWEGLHIELRIV